MAGHIKRRRRGDGSWSYQARIPSPANRRRDIVKTFERKAEAERWLSRQAAAMDEGAFIDPRRGARPCREVIAAYRETWAGLEPKTRAGYESILTRHIEPAYADAKVGSISTKMIQGHVNALAATHAPNTLRRIFSVLRGVLRVAVEHRYIATNPCDAVKLPRKRGARAERMLFLSPNEVRTLADAMPARYQLPVLVAAYCGLRAGELWALRRRDVDALRGVLRVERAIKEINSSAATLEADKGLVIGPTKTHATRKMAMPKFLRGQLIAHLAKPSTLDGDGRVLVIREGKDGPKLSRSRDPFDPDAVVFTTARGNAVRHNLFYKRTFRPVVVGRPAVKGRPARDGRRGRKARPAVPPALPSHLHGLRWHDLRHTCASLSLAVAPNLHIVKERLGHEDIRTTVNIYGHLLPSVDEALADGLDALYDRPANVESIRREGDEPPPDALAAA